MDNDLFTIQHIAAVTGLSAHTLRYYEKIGLLHEVGRDANGYRRYSEADLSWIHFLLRLRATGMPIGEMKRFSDLRSEGDATIGARRELLEAHQNRVLMQIKDLQENLANIMEKIEHYKQMESKQSR